MNKLVSLALAFVMLVLNFELALASNKASLNAYTISPHSLDKKIRENQNKKSKKNKHKNKKNKAKKNKVSQKSSKRKLIAPLHISGGVDLGDTFATADLQTFDNNNQILLMGEIGDNGADVDYIKFIVPSVGADPNNQTLLRITSYGEMDTLGTVLIEDPSGQNVNGIQLYISDDDGPDLNYSFEFWAYPGTYVVKTEDYDNDDAGKYALFVELFTEVSSLPDYFDQHPDSPTAPSITTISLNGQNSQTIDGILDVGDSDYFKLELSTDSFVTISSDTTDSDVTDVYLGLMDSNFGFLGFDFNNGTGSNAKLADKLNAGTYFILVAGNSGPYSLSVSSVLTPANEVQASFSGAVDLGVFTDGGQSNSLSTAGLSNFGEINLPGDSDAYKFELQNEDQLVSFNINNGGNSSTNFITLLDDSGNDISGLIFNFNAAVPLKVGTYYLKNRFAESDVGTYDLGFSTLDIPNETDGLSNFFSYATTASIDPELGESISGAINYTNDADFLEIDLSNPGIISLQNSQESAVQLRYYQNGSLLLSREIETSGNGVEKIFQITSPASAGTDDIKLQIYSFDAIPQGSPINYQIQSSFNALSNASTVSLNSSSTFSLSSSTEGTLGLGKITLTSPGTLDLYTSNADPGTSLRLLDSNANELSFSTSFDGDNQEIFITGLTVGTYYVEVQSAGTDVVLNNIFYENDNVPTLIDFIPSRVANQNQTVNFTISASDNDSFLLEAIETNGGSLPQALSFSQSGNNGNFNWIPSVNNAGSTVDITVQATDSVNNVSSEITDITVLGFNNIPEFTLSPPASVQAVETNTVSFDISILDDDNDPLTLSFAEANGGTLPPGMNLTNNGTGTKTFSWVTQIGDAGSYSVRFTLSDGNGGSITADTTLNINVNSPPSISLSPTGGNYSVTVGNSLSIQISTSDIDGHIPTISMNGQSLPTALSSGFSTSNGSASIAWTPSGADIGTYSFTISADDQNGGISTESITVTVSAVPPPPPPPTGSGSTGGNTSGGGSTGGSSGGNSGNDNNNNDGNSGAENNGEGDSSNNNDDERDTTTLSSSEDGFEVGGLGESSSSKNESTNLPEVEIEEKGKTEFGFSINLKNSEDSNSENNENETGNDQSGERETKPSSIIDNKVKFKVEIPKDFELAKSVKLVDPNDNGKSRKIKFKLDPDKPKKSSINIQAFVKNKKIRKQVEKVQQSDPSFATDGKIEIPIVITSENPDGSIETMEGSITVKLN